MASENLFWNLWDKVQRVKQLVANLNDEVESLVIDIEAAHLVPVTPKPKAPGCAIHLHHNQTRRYSMAMPKRAAMVWKPTRLWTGTQKIEAFDVLYALAVDSLRNYRQDDRSDDNDFKVGIFVEVMELLGDDVWDVINALTG